MSKLIQKYTAPDKGTLSDIICGQLFNVYMLEPETTGFKGDQNTTY